MLNAVISALDFQSQALKLRAQRQETLASNIANADTPNYKARDFDFQAALKTATENLASSRAGEPAGSAQHLASNNSASAAPLLYRLPVQPSIDGNTVDMDVERSMFADNAVRYEAAMRFLNGEIKTIMSAIQG